MSRKVKEYIPVCIKMDKTTYAKLIEFCEESGMTKTATIEKSVDKYIDNYNRIKDL